MFEKKRQPYRGELNCSEIAEGINAARRNAQRLFLDAKILHDQGRYPTACSVAILAIEEAGKTSILRSIVGLKDQKRLKLEWSRYRNHRAKNAMWIIADVVAKGARKLADFREMMDESSDHTLALDQLKQLGFYTDSFQRGRWSCPADVVDEDISNSMLRIATMFADSIPEITVREIELWDEIVVPHDGTPLMQIAAMKWHEAMVEEGLTEIPIERARDFLLSEFFATPRPSNKAPSNPSNLPETGGKNGGNA